ncbi:MAG: hypothetical protein NT039_01700 [Candidatus Berkelbacteria bacterium]|nr:hypothetical protein [Candidatus Berkelbacteria bacterium]
MTEEVKNENLRVKPTVQSQRKQSCFNFRNCCFCCLGILIALIISALILLSLSGLVRIPLLSPLFYGNGPSPSRIVTPQTIDDKYIENLFKTASNNNQTQVVINENVLSYLVNNYVNKENNVLVPENERTTGSQISFENGSAELFLKPRSPRTALTIKIIPAQSRLMAQRFKLGKLRTPVFALNMLFSQYFDFNSMYTSGIKSIQLEKGRVVVTIDPAMFKGDRPEGEAPIPFIPH